jgi:putative ABC transport system permease protein
LKSKQIIPPQLARKLLLLFLRNDLTEEVLGDLDENFSIVAKEKSPGRAKFNYWFQVCNYLRPFAIRKSRGINIHSMGMIQNYFVITRRTLLKQKLYAFINVAGLSIGLASFLIIMLYVQHEFSYNKFYPNANNLYRVYQRQQGNQFLGTDFFSVTPGKLPSVMKDEFPEVSHATSVEQSSGLIKFNNETFYEQGLAGDGEFFKVFPIDFVLGSAGTALTDPKAIILTESLAKRIFNDKDPIGEMVDYQEENGFKITGVIPDPPASSSLRYSFIVNIAYNTYWKEEQERAGWTGNSFYTFFELVDGADPRALEKKFPALLKKYRDAESYKDYPFSDTYYVQPIGAMYFQSGINFDLGLKGNVKVVYSFLAAACLVLLLACVNYMNLAIARSIKRSREVGIRKAAGALKRQIIFQFLTESILIAFVSLIIAIGLTNLLLPYFSNLLERPIQFDILSNKYLLPGLFAVVLLVGSLSGSYPAFVMSSLKPIQVLKARANVTFSGFGLQRALMVLQFTTSITLVIVSLLIHRQIKFMQDKDLGYNKDEVVVLQLQDRSLREKFETLQNEWNQNPNVVAATLTSHLPTNITSSTIVTKSPDDKGKAGLSIYRWSAGYDLLDVFDLKLLAGRTFSREITTDIEQTCLINETAAKALGWSAEEAVGKEIFHGDPIKIVGVLQDFHMHSMHLAIEPLMIFVAENRGNFIAIKIKPGNNPQTVSSLETSVRKLSPYPFQYEFLSDIYTKLYKAEARLGEIFGFFTLVSILIACLGLFGLAAFLCEQRTKEIGIRKVLGASVNSIVFLVSKDLLALVMVAVLIAFPISWYMISVWLQDFAYKMEIEWWVFALAGVLALVVANISIGYQSIKASVVNPVDSLKVE